MLWPNERWLIDYAACYTGDPSLEYPLHCIVQIAYSIW
jgi:hypothetical protein